MLYIANPRIWLADTEHDRVRVALERETYSTL